MMSESRRAPLSLVEILAAALVLLSAAGFFLPLRASEEVAKDDEAQIDRVLSAVKKAYSALPSLEADFVQTSSGASFVRPLVQEGVLAIKAPNRLDWVFHTPRPQRFVSNGKLLWVIDEGDKVCVVYRQMGSQLRRLLGFLTGMRDLKKAYRVEWVSAGPEARSNRWVLKLRPRAPGNKKESIHVQIDPDSGLLLGLVLDGGLGERTETQLLRLRTEVELPDDRFEWARPEGFRVVEGG